MAKYSSGPSLENQIGRLNQTMHADFANPNASNATISISFGWIPHDGTSSSSISRYITRRVLDI